MLQYYTKGFSGYNLQYSPYYDNKIALVTGSNFGLIGNGKLFILNIEPNGRIVESNAFLTKDCLFDVSWNESNSNQVLVAQGDGTLRLFDINLRQYPIAIFKEHQREVLSCDWSLISKDRFVSSSWDGTIKIWSPLRTKNSLFTLTQCNKANEKVDNGKNCIYQAKFSPHNDNIIISSSGNSIVTLYDLRVNAGNNTNNTNDNNNNNVIYQFISNSGLETLCCDFNKYRPHIIATGGVDNRIKIWDLRMLRNDRMKFNGLNNNVTSCVNEIVNGHDLAIRQIKWSPHSSHHLMSTSYDMTACVWNDLSFNGKVYTGQNNMTHDRFNHGCIKRMNKHTEFVFGADWSLWGQPGIVATTSWDGYTYVWNGLR